MKEQNNFDVIKELTKHNSNQDRASLKLAISKRQINRLIIKHKNDEKYAFVHGNHEHIPTKALDKSIT